MCITLSAALSCQRPNCQNLRCLLKFFYGDNLNFYSQLKPYLLNFFETSKIFRNKIRKNNLLVDSQGACFTCKKKDKFFGEKTDGLLVGR